MILKKYRSFNIFIFLLTLPLVIFMGYAAVIIIGRGFSNSSHMELNFVVSSLGMLLLTWLCFIPLKNQFVLLELHSDKLVVRRGLFASKVFPFIEVEVDASLVDYQGGNSILTIFAVFLSYVYIVVKLRPTEPWQSNRKILESFSIYRPSSQAEQIAADVSNESPREFRR